MIWLMKILMLGHVHKWKILKQEPYQGHYGNPNKIVATGTQYTLQCEKCGNMKRWLS